MTTKNNTWTVFSSPHIPHHKIIEIGLEKTFKIIESTVSSALLISTPSDTKDTLITPMELVTPWKERRVACPVGSSCRGRALWGAGIWCFRMFWYSETSPACTEMSLWHSDLPLHGDQSFAASRPFHLRCANSSGDRNGAVGPPLCISPHPFLIFLCH